MAVEFTNHPKLKDCIVAEGQTYKAVKIKDMDGDKKKETAYVPVTVSTTLGFVYADIPNKGNFSGFLRFSSEAKSFQLAEITRTRHEPRNQSKGHAYTVTTATIKKPILEANN